MQEKQVFHQQANADTRTDFQPKQQFSPEDVEIDVEQPALEGEWLESQFEQAVAAKSSAWKRAIWALVLLFLAATVAQSAQWLIDAWRANQWIYLAFALVGVGAVGLGISALWRELWRLRHLRQHLLRQQQSQQWTENPSQSAVDFSGVLHHAQAVAFCENTAIAMQLDADHPDIIRWKNQVNEAHSGQEVAWLFSQNVLQPLDRQAKKMIVKTAVESAVVVAVSPLALVDMFFVAWRNIRLINQIAALYRMDLGYFSRLRLMKLVLLNMAFTGATELINEVGMDWLSQDITAKLSARAAQGIGVGLLTARLGIKALEFCRPMAFQPQEKIKLRHIQQALLTQVKDSLFKQTKVKFSEKV